MDDFSHCLGNTPCKDDDNDENDPLNESTQSTRRINQKSEEKSKGPRRRDRTDMEDYGEGDGEKVGVCEREVGKIDKDKELEGEPKKKEKVSSFKTPDLKSCAEKLLSFDTTQYILAGGSFHLVILCWNENVARVHFEVMGAALIAGRFFLSSSHFLTDSGIGVLQRMEKTKQKKEAIFAFQKDGAGWLSKMNDMIKNDYNPYRSVENEIIGMKLFLVFCRNRKDLKELEKYEKLAENNINNGGSSVSLLPDDFIGLTKQLQAKDRFHEVKEVHVVDPAIWKSQKKRKPFRYFNNNRNIFNSSVPGVIKTKPIWTDYGTDMMLFELKETIKDEKQLIHLKLPFIDHKRKFKRVFYVPRHWERSSQDCSEKKLEDEEMKTRLGQFYKSHCFAMNAECDSKDLEDVVNQTNSILSDKTDDGTESQFLMETQDIQNVQQIDVNPHYPEEIATSEDGKAVSGNISSDESEGESDEENCEDNQIRSVTGKTSDEEKELKVKNDDEKIVTLKENEKNPVVDEKEEKEYDADSDNSSSCDESDSEESEEEFVKSVKENVKSAPVKFTIKEFESVEDFEKPYMKNGSHYNAMFFGYRSKVSVVKYGFTKQLGDLKQGEYEYFAKLFMKYNSLKKYPHVNQTGKGKEKVFNVSFDKEWNEDQIKVRKTCREYLIEDLLKGKKDELLLFLERHLGISKELNSFFKLYPQYRPVKGNNSEVRNTMIANVEKGTCFPQYDMFVPHSTSGLPVMCFLAKKPNLSIHTLAGVISFGDNPYVAKCTTPLYSVHTNSNFIGLSKDENQAMEEETPIDEKPEEKDETRLTATLIHPCCQSGISSISFEPNYMFLKRKFDDDGGRKRSLIEQVISLLRNLRDDTECSIHKMIFEEKLELFRPDTNIELANLLFNHP